MVYVVYWIDKEDHVREDHVRTEVYVTEDKALNRLTELAKKYDLCGIYCVKTR